jgi:hypothetical protein
MNGTLGIAPLFRSHTLRQPNKSWIRRMFLLCPTKLRYSRRNRSTCTLFSNGLCCRTNTTLDKDEWINLHHFSPISAADRDPTTLGRELDDDDEWRNALTDETNSIHVNAGRHTQANEIDHVPTRPKFGWLSADIIRATFQSTTQYDRLSGSEFLKKHYKPPFHALTMFRSDAAFTKQLVHGLLDGESLYKLRLAPIDGEFLRQFVQFKEISPCKLSPTDNIVHCYRSSPSLPPPKMVIGCSILDAADLIGWLFLMDKDNGERPSSSSPPPKPIIARPIKDPTDLIGWLSLKDKGNGERHRDDLSSLLGRECSTRSHIDPADRIVWLFDKDHDNGERPSSSSSPPKLIVVRPICECPEPVIVHQIQGNGERPSSSQATKPVVVRSTMDTTHLVGWLFLKDQDDGDRHRVQMLSYFGCVRPFVHQADLIDWLPDRSGQREATSRLAANGAGHRSFDHGFYQPHWLVVPKRPGQRGASSRPDVVPPWVRSSDHDH